jgi:hypothetical protein
VEHPHPSVHHELLQPLAKLLDEREYPLDPSLLAFRPLAVTLSHGGSFPWEKHPILRSGQGEPPPQLSTAIGTTPLVKDTPLRLRFDHGAGWPLDAGGFYDPTKEMIFIDDGLFPPSPPSVNANAQGIVELWASTSAGSGTMYGSYGVPQGASTGWDYGPAPISWTG